MRILITGGAGFLGSHLVRYLLAEKYTMVVLDDLSTSSLEHLSELDVVLWKKDICNPDIIH